jgi:hypothetical protein
MRSFIICTHPQILLGRLYQGESVLNFGLDFVLMGLPSWTFIVTQIIKSERKYSPHVKYYRINFILFYRRTCPPFRATGLQKLLVNSFGFPFAPEAPTQLLCVQSISP